MERIAFAVLAVALGCTPAAAQDSWRFSLTPYVWLPNVNATMNFSPPPGAGRPAVDVGPNDYLEHLDTVLMLSGEARRGDWAVLADVIYLDFSKEAARVVPVNAATQASLKGFVWQVAASRTVSQTGKATTEVLGGLRYFALEAGVDWQLAGLFPLSGSQTQKEELWDAIVGVRGKIRLGEGSWFVPWYFDAGAGSSALTWQGFTGIGYAWKWGDALLAYRHVYYDQEGGKLLQDVSFSGPAVAATFRF